MNKILCGLCFILLLSSGCDNKNSTAQTEFDESKIYFFYHDRCPYCHDAMDFLNTNYPTLPVTMVNVYNDGGLDLLKRCADKFELGQNIGTPLLCMGKHYIMGWSETSPRQFDNYVRLFLKK